jgi:glycogen(starch) synthase
VHETTKLARHGHGTYYTHGDNHHIRLRAGLRIVLLPSAYAPAVGGVEELTRRLAERLQVSGDAVEVWTNRHPLELPAREAIDGIEVRRFPLPLPRLDRSVAGFPYAAGAALVGLRRAAAELRPEILHAQCFSGNGVYAIALARALRVPLVVTLQGETVMDDHDIYDHSAALRAGLRFGLRTASAVTGCSEFVLDDARARFGLGAGDGTVVPNGADSATEEAQLPFAVPFERFVLGLGRVVEKKGFDLLLRAFAPVAAGDPTVGLVIGGDGAARPGLRQLASELGLAERVVFPGTLSRGQVAWAMANATVFVLPSRVEPFGIVVLEAMGVGRAVVVSSRGGAPEIVRDGVDGLVADPFDEVALAAAITRLLADERLRRNLGAAAAVRAADFSWDAIAERYREIYRTVLAAA